MRREVQTTNIVVAITTVLTVHGIFDIVYKALYPQ